VVGSVGHPKARFNNVLFSRNLNKNMSNIALFLKKKGKNFEALGSSALRPRVVTYLHTVYCLCDKLSKCAILTLVHLVCLRLKYYNRVAIANILSLILRSDVARPLSYKTIHLFFQDQDRFFKDHKIINPRPLA